VTQGPTPELHRHLAAATFNAAWDLIEKPDRSADDNALMLLSAATSRWHWAMVGGPEELAAGDWQVAHVACLLGFSDLALLFARRNLATAVENGWDGWRLASAHEGMARASAGAGDGSARDDHIRRAEEALAREPDEDDRKVIDGQLATVPAV
jgi:hypothetical protein